MLRFPSGWIQHFGVNLATGYPPDLGARLRYHERIRPPQSFSRIVESILASDPEFHAHEIGEMERIVTVEGEYGAWVAIDGRREVGRAQRFIGVVFLDDFATALDALAVKPAHFGEIEQLARELVRTQRFELYRRPRRFFYDPPAGWHGMPSGLAATWYPLDFPKNASSIIVPPAAFLDGDRDAAIEKTIADGGDGLAIESTLREAVVSASGVEGALVRLSGRRDGGDVLVHRELAVFAVAPYLYRMRLETTNASQLLELREAFGAVARSFEPLPGRS